MHHIWWEHHAGSLACLVSIFSTTLTHMLSIFCIVHILKLPLMSYRFMEGLEFLICFQTIADWCIWDPRKGQVHFSSGDCSWLVEWTEVRENIRIKNNLDGNEALCPSSFRSILKYVFLQYNNAKVVITGSGVKLSLEEMLFPYRKLNVALPSNEETSPQD